MSQENDMVREFYTKADGPLDIELHKSNTSYGILQLRTALIMEEAKEVAEAVDNLWGTVWKANNKASYTEHKQRLLKELMDLKYVVEGMCATYGMNSEEAFTRVHKSNMTKLDSIEKDKDGKIMKSEDYQPPDMEGLV